LTLFLNDLPSDDIDLPTQFFTCLKPGLDALNSAAGRAV
jgi:hypothetical protein